MNTFLEKLFNWWVSRPSNISLGEETVSIQPKIWIEISWFLVLVLTLLPIIISILICYSTTRRMGNTFLKRWWLFLIITSIFNGILIFFYLKSQTFSSGYAETLLSFGIPNFVSMNRAVVGVIQSIIGYYLVSIVIVKLLGGLFNVTKYRNNLNYPFPKLF